MNIYKMCDFLSLYKKVTDINVKYAKGVLNPSLDEAGAGGYWDLAGEYAGENEVVQDMLYDAFVSYFLREEIDEKEFLKIYAEAVEIKLNDALNSGSNSITVSKEKLTTEVWQLVEEDGFFKGAVQCDLITIDLSIEDCSLIKKLTEWNDVPSCMKDRVVMGLNPKLLK